MIRREGGKYVVKNSAGTQVLGRHDTRREALDQLRAIEASKHRREANDGATRRH